MDKLKPYAIPILGLILLLVYWIVVRPLLADQATSDATKTDATEKPSPPPTTKKPSPPPTAEK